MIHFLYNLILTCYLLLDIPYLLAQVTLKKCPKKLMKERLGNFPNLSMKHPIWIHAASVGEVLCCLPLLKRIRKELPETEMILTTMTTTGHETARKLLPEANWIFYFPVDHPFMIWRVLKKISPRLLLIAETELWPNLLLRCGKRSIPVILFNGRISEKSLRGYLLFKPFFKSVLSHIAFFLMQTEEDRRRIIEIGAPPDRTAVVGNIKFDQAPPFTESEPTADLLASLGLHGDEIILIAGSTHPGEEELLLPIFKKLKEIYPHLLLLLAPRHLNRLDEVESLLRRGDLDWKRRSSLPDQRCDETCSVILLDTMGELMKLYCLGTVVFIGGSLVSIGGHNPLEPLFFKKCVLFGPYMFNFLEISRHLIAEGGAILVKDGEELLAQLKRLLSDEKARNEAGENGFRFLQKHRGATERIFEKIQPFLN
jgi:3-deoxy-D-manno-octulosonic-acid transferase